MAYLIISHKDQEVARHELTGCAVTLGRSPECDLRIHDILLSRRHCRIEPMARGWAIADLGSKNGTRVGGKAVLVGIPLAENDVIRMGNTAVRFREGAFVPGAGSQRSSLQRPADPFEALAGTVSDFTFRPPVIGPTGMPFPSPRPSPQEPAAYVEEDVRSLVCDLMSSSWDSIYEGASRPDLMVAHAHAAEERAIRRKRPREPRVDLALQVAAEDARQPAGVTPDLMSVLTPPTSAEPAAPLSRRRGFVLRRLAAIFQWLPLMVLPLFPPHG